MERLFRKNQQHHVTKRQVLRKTDTCEHPDDKQIAMEYKGWYDGISEWRCMACGKRRTRDRVITLHHDQIRYHPYYGVVHLEIKRWAYDLHKDDMRSNKPGFEQLKKNADIFLREYLQKHYSTS